MNTSDAHPDIQARLRALPAVDHVLNQPAIVNLLDDYPRGEVVLAVRAVLEERRAALLEGEDVAIDTPGLSLDIRQRLYERSRPRLRRVINATGIVMHTNLGRAPLAEEAVDAIVEAAGYCNLELNLDTGSRGNRHDHLRDLLCELCGTEDAFVVNNNAAATFLVLNTFAAGREAVISRGQLVEIGGSYRMPDIMAAAQCRMVEVGTTNRTRIADYERAITDETAMLVRVHCSNYRIEGFTESTPLAELVELGRRHNVLVVDDLGSGLMTEDLPWPAGDLDLAEQEAFEETDSDEGDDERELMEVPNDMGEDEETPPGPADWDEPSIIDSVNTGADLSFFSGDKLIGGPQAGIIVGSASLIEAVRKNPLARAFRPDKLTLASLEATLRIYRDPDAIHSRIPIYRMLSKSRQTIEAEAHQLAEALATALPNADIHGEEDYSEAGGGSLATLPFPTWVVVVSLPDYSAADIATILRQRDVPIICRIRDDALVFDPRTLSPDDAAQIPGAVAEAVNELGAE